MKHKFLAILACSAATLGLFPVPSQADIYDAIVICEVTGLRSGQLALRHEPHGQPFAGLNNGNVVRAYGGTIAADGSIWDHVKILEGPNAQVEGYEGYVNSNYLYCRWYAEDGTLIREG
jgi:hypothetical protein